MEQLGTSHIAAADLIVFGSGILLIVLLGNLPTNSKLVTPIAAVCGGIVLAIIGLLLFDGQNLNSNAAHSLAIMAVYMCFSLWGWEERRRRGDRTPAEPPV